MIILLTPIALDNTTLSLICVSTMVKRMHTSGGR